MNYSCYKNTRIKNISENNVNVVLLIHFFTQFPPFPSFREAWYLEEIEKYFFKFGMKVRTEVKEIPVDGSGSSCT